MKIYISNSIHFKTDEISDELVLKIQKYFRQKDPMYVKSDNKRDFTEDEKYINMYTIKNGKIFLPRGVYDELEELLSEEIDINDIEIVDKRLLLEEVDFPLLKYDLYKHQKKVSKLGYKIGQGTFQAGCFKAGTKVKTLYGEKNIEDITTDDIVLSYDEKLDRVVLKKVVNHYKNKLNKRVVKVSIQGLRNYYNGGNDIYEVYCTEDHKFYSNGVWIEAKDLKGRYVYFSDLKICNCYDLMKELYCKEQLSIEEIADISDCGTFNINNKIKEFHLDDKKYKYEYPVEIRYNYKSVLCKCGCGQYTKQQGEYCQGHHQSDRFAKMSKKEKLKLLKPWIDAGYKAMQEGHKRFYENMTDEEKQKFLEPFLKSGNKSSLKSKLKGSRHQELVYKYLQRYYPQYEWIYNHVITIRNQNYYQYDIYCKDLNLLIEYDGIFHYKPIYGIERFNEQLKQDKIKNKVALHNDYMLIRINGEISSNDGSLYSTLLQCRKLVKYIDKNILNCKILNNKVVTIK